VLAPNRCIGHNDIIGQCMKLALSKGVGVMRGMLVALLVLGWVPVILFKPHVGVLVWNWVSHMAPHSYTYNFARDFPFLVAIFFVTAIGMVLNKDKKSLPAHPLIFGVIIYWLWLVFTTLVSMDNTGLGLSTTKLIHISKVLIFVLISIAVMQSPNRLKGFVWVMSLSLGYIGVKGGLFTIITGGGARVEGAGGMMGDNNQLAMAMAMFTPMAIYLVQHPPLKIMKWPLIGAAILVPLSAVGTQSRGGFVALAAVIFMLILKTKHKFKTLFAVALLGWAAIAFMPDSWKNRMQTTESAATEDGSFRGRVSMWKFSVNLVDDYPVEGGGFNVFYVPRAKELYMPPGFIARAPHSIYFEVLAEHGYVGLILFLTLIFTGWFSAGTQAKLLRRYQETKWLGDLCAALQLSLIGYAVGGLTVNIATFDVFYHVLAIIVMCHVVGEQLLAGTLTLVGSNRKLAANKAADKWSPGVAAAPQENR